MIGRLGIKRLLLAPAIMLVLLIMVAGPAFSQFSPNEAQGYYMLDKLGGLYAVGSISAPLNFSDFPLPADEETQSYVGLALTPDAKGLWALTADGRVLTRGNAQGELKTPLWGFNIGRDIEAGANDDYSGVYVLDGYGGVHEVGTASPIGSQDRPYFGWDIARDIEVMDGGYVLLDGFGGVFAVGLAERRLPVDATSGQVIPSAYFGWDIAVDIEIVPSYMGGKGYYELDGFGGVHRRGEFAEQFPNVYFGWDIAKDLELFFFSDLGYTHWQLDGYGGVHPTADQTDIVDDPRHFVRFSLNNYFGWDVAVDFEVVKSQGTPQLIPTATITPTLTPTETSFIPTFTPTPTVTLTPTPTETSFSVNSELTEEEMSMAKKWAKLIKAGKWGYYRN